MQIAVIGAGNIGTQCAIEFASKGHEVIFFTSQPHKIESELWMFNEKNEVIKKAKIKKVTNDIEEALQDTEYVIITYPAFMLRDFADLMYEHVRADMKIGVIPGTGGAEYFFKKHIEKGASLFGLQRVPAVARLKQYGKSVVVAGKREKLHVAALPNRDLEEISKMLSSVFEMPCEILPNYLCVTLTPSNPILHTTRLRTMFKDYYEGYVYEKNILFYQEWSDESSELLLKCDEELQKICMEIDGMDLTEVRSLKMHYESRNSKELTAKLQSIKSLQGLLSPMEEVVGGFIPDFNSRYFTADFPYGLSIIIQIADIAGVSVPNLKETLEWYYRLVNKSDELKISEYGVCSLKELYQFYS